MRRSYSWSDERDEWVEGPMWDDLAWVLVAAGCVIVVLTAAYAIRGKERD